MKISPLAGSSGTLGTSLGAVDIGRTADANKMQRAKAIAAGQTPEEPKEVIPQVDKVSTKRIQMRTNYSTNRDLETALAAAQTDDAAVPPKEPEQSSTVPNTEQGTVEATQPLSPQLAAIARQKRALQLERAEFEKQKAELAGKQPEEGKYVPVDRLKSNPLSVLSELGVSYDQITEAILNGQGADPKVQALEQRIKELESGLDKKLTDRDQAAEQAALAEMKREAQSLAASDEYELVRATNSVPTVMQLIEKTYRTTGEVLDVAEAMRLVEAELVKDSEKLLGTKKLAGKLQPQQQPQAAAPQRQLKTLTSSGNTQAPLTARQRALMAFHGTLKG